MRMWAVSRSPINVPRDRTLLNIGLSIFLLTVSVILAERIASGHHISLFLAIGASTLLVLVVIKPRLVFSITLFFLIVPFTLGVYQLYQILEVANFLIVLLFVSWIARKTVSRESLSKSPLNAPVIAYLLLVLLSYFRNLRPLTDPTNLPHVWAALSIMIYLLTSDIIRRKYHIYMIRHCFFIFFNIAFLVTLYIAFTGAELPFISSMAFFNRGGRTPLVVGGGVHGVGLFGIACILFLLSQPSYIRMRWIRYLLLVIYFTAIPLSGSRSVLLVLLGSLAFLLLSQKKLKYVAGFTVAVILIWIYVPEYYYSFPLVAQRMVTFSPVSVQYGSSVQSRLSMWVASLKLWQEAPVFGIGYGFIDRYPLTLDPYISLMSFSRGVHNGYIFILRSLGAFGVALFGWMMFTFFKQAFKLRRRTQESSIRQFVLFLIIYTVSILIGIAVGGGINRPPLYLMFGLISAVYVMNMSNQQGQAE